MPIHPELDRACRFIHAKPGRVHPDSFGKALARLREGAGFYFTSHQLRKTFSSTLYDGRVDDRVVKELLGHTQDVTGRYIVVSRARKVEAIARLDYLS